jgi:SAM-dependent methyltransferase
VDGFLAFAPELAHQGDGFKAEFFDQYVDLEASHFWFRSRNRLITWALRRFFPHAESFLEVGCGTGYVLDGVRASQPDLSLIGSEVFTHGLELAQARLPSTRFYQIDARRMPFVEEIDVVGVFDVVEHIDEDEVVLRELFRAARPGGGLILTVPQHRWLWSSLDDHSFHRRRYARRELVAKARRAGFTSIWCTSFVMLLLPVVLASRLRQPKSADAFDPNSELLIPRPVNWLFERVMDIERHLIQWGISLPIGGSLLLVARKAAS